MPAAAVEQLISIVAGAALAIAWATVAACTVAARVAAALTNRRAVPKQLVRSNRLKPRRAWLDNLAAVNHAGPLPNRSRCIGGRWDDFR